MENSRAFGTSSEITRPVPNIKNEIQILFSVRKYFKKAALGKKRRFRTEFFNEFFILKEVFKLVPAKNGRRPKLLRILYFNEAQSLPKVYFKYYLLFYDNFPMHLLA